jgi:uncharacterized OsmC-like protein
MTRQLDIERQLDDFDVTPPAKNNLFVIGHARRDGFWASIRGHVLDLADPASDKDLAPTPDDLFIASIASDFAWCARSLLRARELPDTVSVSATWRTDNHPRRVTDISLTVVLSRRAEAARAALATAFANNLAARSLVAPVVHISFEGAQQ